MIALARCNGRLKPSKLIWLASLPKPPLNVKSILHIHGYVSNIPSLRVNTLQKSGVANQCAANSMAPFGVIFKIFGRTLARF